MYSVNGKQYKLVDFFSEFTTEQGEEALKIITPLLGDAILVNLLNGDGGGARDVIHLIKLLSDASDSSNIRRLLAIFFVENGKEFSLETLPDAMNDMGKAKVVPMLKEALGSFFSFFLPVQSHTATCSISNTFKG